MCFQPSAGGTRLLSRPGHRCGPDHGEGVTGRRLSRPGTTRTRTRRWPRLRASAPSRGARARLWPRTKRGDRSRAASPEPAVGPGWSRGRWGARRGRAATPREAPRPSSSDQYPFQEHTVLQREERSSLRPRRQAAVISFLCRVICRLTHPEKHSPRPPHPPCPCGTAVAVETARLSLPAPSPCPRQTLQHPPRGEISPKRGPGGRRKRGSREEGRGKAGGGTPRRPRSAHARREERVPVWPRPDS